MNSVTKQREGSISKWGLLILGPFRKWLIPSLKSAPKGANLYECLRKTAAPFGLMLLIVGLQACVSGPLPIDEFTLARSAIDAAKAVEAARYAPGYWSQAEEAFRRAKILLAEKENEEARIEFLRARLAAERAENSARYTRFKNGEVL